MQRKSYSDYLETFSKTKITRTTMYADLLKLNVESYSINFNTSTIKQKIKKGTKSNNVELAETVITPASQCALDIIHAIQHRKNHQ